MDVKVPSNLVLAARLSGSISSVVSLVYMMLTALCLIYYFNCETVDMQTTPHTDYFWSTVYRVYLQNEECEQKLTVPNLTQSYTVLVLVAITLSFSVVTFFTSIAITFMISFEEAKEFVNVYVYAYVGSWLANLVVDITLGTHLGMDITHLANELDDANIYNPALDLLRQGAFYLMAISLKGFAIHAIQLVLVCLIIVYLYDYQDMLKKSDHPIHKMESINAFEQPRRLDENWPAPDMYAMESFPRGHLNNNFVDDNARPHPNALYNNPRAPTSFRRSDSWNHQGPSSMQQPPSSSSARPFSYLEEIRRPAAPVPRSPQAPWTAPAPRVPAPDYSPHSPRRLKSALKPNMY